MKRQDGYIEILLFLYLIVFIFKTLFNIAEYIYNFIYNFRQEYKRQKQLQKKYPGWSVNDPELDFCDEQLYIIQTDDEEYTKIGISKNPHKRLKQLQTGNPRKLNLMIHYPVEGGDPYRIEKQIHEHFSRYRVEGEWFQDLDLDKIEKYIERRF